jgi:hypothetical protein
MSEKARLPSSPQISLALHPDARAAILTRRALRTSSGGRSPPPLRSDALEAARGAKALFRLTREFRDTFGTPWRRDIGSGLREDPQPRAAATRRISSTTDA